MLIMTENTYILLCTVFIWRKAFAENVIKCKSDEYFDDKTGNCDKCKPICDISDCSNVCPFYTSTIPGATNAQYDSRIVGIITGCLVGFFVILSTLLWYCLYKRHCKLRNILNKNQTEQKEPVQATEDVQDRQDVLERELLNPV